MGLFRGLGGLEGLLLGQTSTRFEAQGLGGFRGVQAFQMVSSTVCEKLDQIDRSERNVAKHTYRN